MATTDTTTSSPWEEIPLIYNLKHMSKVQKLYYGFLFTCIVFISLFGWFFVTVNSYGMKHDLSFLQSQQIATLKQMRQTTNGKNTIEQDARRMIIDGKISKIFAAAPYVHWTQYVAKWIDSKIFTIHNENRIYVPFGVRKHILAADARVMKYLKAHPAIEKEIEQKIPKKVQFAVRVRNEI